MRIGTNYNPPHKNPGEWAQKCVDLGAHAIAFPVDYRASVSVIDEYVKAAQAHNLLIAEVGVWNSPFHPDPVIAKQAYERLEEQLRLADYIGARCCVNVSGAVGPVWYYLYPENFSSAHYDDLVTMVQKLIDTVHPTNTCFTLESMQWMPPDSPEQYARLLHDVDRSAFAAHLDMTNFIKDAYTYTHQQELLERCIRLLGPHIRSCHLKDCKMEEGLTVAIHEVLPGTGDMILPEYLRAVSTLGEDMPILVEHLKSESDYRTAIAYAHALNSSL